MFRIVLRAVVIVSVILLALSAYVWDQRAAYLSKWLSSAMQVPTRVKEFSWTKDTFTFSGFHVSSPEGSRSDTAFAAQQIMMRANPRTFLSSNVTIDEIVVNDPLLGIEMYSADGTENNWSLMLNRLNLMASAEKSSTKYHVKRVVLNNVRIHVENSALDLPAVNPPPIERIELRDIGSDEPLPYRMVLAAIFKEVLKHASSQQGLHGILKNIKALQAKIQIDGKTFEPPRAMTEEGGIIRDRLHDLEKSLRALLEDEPQPDR